MKPEKKKLFLQIVHLCKTFNLSSIKQIDIAMNLNVSRQLIIYHFESMEKLKTEVMQYAVEERIVEIVADGIIHKNPIALKADDELRQECSDFMKAIK